MGEFPQPVEQLALLQLVLHEIGDRAQQLRLVDVAAGVVDAQHAPDDASAFVQRHDEQAFDSLRSQHLVLFGLVIELLQIRDADHAGLGEAVRPSLERRQRHLLQLVYLGLDAVSAPFERIGDHRSVQRRFQQVGAIGVVELPDDAQQLVQAVLPAHVAGKRLGAAHQGALDAQLRLQSQKLVAMIGHVEGYLKPRRAAVPVHDLVLQRIGSIVRIVVLGPRVERIPPQQMVRAEVAGTLLVLHHAVAGLPFPVVPHHLLERFAGIQHLVGFEIADVGDLAQIVEYVLQAPHGGPAFNSTINLCKLALNVKAVAKKSLYPY